MAMELTCLGLGKDQGKWAGPSCHLLQVSGAHLLLECPLDLSMLHLFLPAAKTITYKQDADMHDTHYSKRADSTMDALQNTSRKRRRYSFHDEDDQISWLHIDDMDGLHVRSASDAHTDAFARSREAEKSGSPHSSNMRPEATATLNFTRVVNGYALLDVEPWYKTAEFGLLDVSSIDAVIISNPEGMLGLPFLTRMARFSGKIYATSVTAKLGQLMMEELVSMHAEYVQNFGRSDTSKKPSWLDLTALDAFSAWMKKALVDNDGVGRANWLNLYRKNDIDKCMKQVHCLHYDEEINIYDCLCIKPCSSGSELGASNWVISGARRLSYFSASGLMSGYCMALNVVSHVSSDALLFCDLKSRSVEEGNAQNSRSGSDEAFCTDYLSKDAQTVHYKNPSPETEERHRALYVNLVEELPLVCKAVLDAVLSGGSVLMSINGIGALLEALEVISQALDTSNLGSNIPMFFISPVAEEILVYANTVPEWLCTTRQEKLYAGEALFGHVELLQQKRLHHLSTLYSPHAVKLWREPCVVFVLDWALRMGPAVPLLHKWRLDPHCLLVLSQVSINAELALAPFQPLTMKILLYNRGGKLGEAEVSAIIEKLKPELSMVPETMRVEFEQLVDGNVVCSRGNMGFYDVWDVLTIPAPARIEVDMAAEVACQVHPKQLDSGIALSQMTMSVRQKEGRWLLDLPISSEVCNAREDFCWGTVKTTDLVNMLKDHGLCCEVSSKKHDDTSSKSLCEDCIIISFPSPAKVELRPHSTLIETDDPIVRQLVADALKRLLHFV